MNVEFKTIPHCNANPCSYVMTRKGRLLYYWQSLTHFAPVRFHYSNYNLPNFQRRALDVFILRKYMILIALNPY